MMGFADMMNAETFGPLGDERYRAYAAHMQTCGRELLEATETTLTMAALLARPNHHDTTTSTLRDLVSQAWSETVHGRPNDACRLTTYLPENFTIKGDIPSIKQGIVALLGAAITRAGSRGPITITANGDHDRIDASISVQASPDSGAPSNGCRPATSACPAIEALKTTVSRTLFGLQGIPLVEAIDASGRWTASLSFEAAAQSDMFDESALSGYGKSDANHTVAYSAGFFAGGSLSESRSI